MASHHGSPQIITDIDDLHDGDAPDAVTIQMSGTNMVVRSSEHIDRATTESVVLLVNSSTTTEIAVVIDPEQIRCSDAFASTPAESSELHCCTRPDCLPREVETIGDGVVRIAGEQSWWTIDIGAGRFIRSDRPVDVRFVGKQAWAALQGIWITGVKLSILTADGGLVSGYRARSDDRCTRRLVS